MQTEFIDSSTEQHLNDNLVRLHFNLTMNGVIPNHPAQESISTFCRSSTQKQKMILENMDKYIETLTEHVEPRDNRSGRQLEVARLKKALAVFGYKALDDSIFNLIEENDVVEFYNSEGVQLYRNLSFLKVCSYSLIDLAVNSWDELYEKPALVTSQIHAKIRDVLFEGHLTIPFEIPSFVQKEKFVFAKKLQAFIVNAKYISPLENISTGDRTAFIITFRGALLAEGEESMKINIL